MKAPDKPCIITYICNVGHIRQRYSEMVIDDGNIPDEQPCGYFYCNKTAYLRKDETSKP